MFDWLVTEFSRRQFGSQGWPTVLAAALFALVVLGIVYDLLQHAVRETRAVADRGLATQGRSKMGAGTETLGGGTEGQALDIKEFSPRVSHGDVIVFALSLLLVAGRWPPEAIHDNRTVSAEAGGITVTYPRGWFRFPVEEPELLRVVSNQDGDTTLLLFAEPAGQAGLLEAVGLRRR